MSRAGDRSLRVEGCLHRWVFLVAPLLLSCAIALQPAHLVPSLPKQTSHDKSVAVQTIKEFRQGLKLLQPDFQQAVKSGIRDSGLFSRVLDALPADYLLEVELISYRAPGQGFSATVAISSKWTLTNGATLDQVYEEIHTAEYTVGAGDAFVGATRVRLAAEGAVRETIRQGIEGLGKLEL